MKVVHITKLTSNKKRLPDELKPLVLSHLIEKYRQATLWACKNNTK